MILTGSNGDLQIVARPPQPWNSYSALASDTIAGRSVSPEGALSIAHVFGAVRLVSTTGGTLPLEVLDESKKTRSVVSGGLIAPLLRHRPNPDMSASVVWTLVLAHLMLRGNAYLAKVRDEFDNVTALYPINPANVHPFRDDTGAKMFRVLQFVGSKTVDRVFSSREILHILGPSLDDGMMGASPISLVRNRLGVQAAQSEAQGRFYAQGMHARGVLQLPAGSNVSAEAMERFSKTWNSQNHGLDNAGKTPVLPGGLQYQAISLSPADAQFIETMRWGATEVATLFSIPASRLNADSGSNAVKYANVGQDDVHFMKQAVIPQLSFVESAINMDEDLFGFRSSWVPRFNTTAALRADDQTRFQAYQIATGGQPWMNAQEVRDLEGLGAGGPAPVAAVAPPAPAARTRPVDSRDDMRDDMRDVVRGEMRTIVRDEVRDVPVQPAPIVTVNVPEQPAPVVNVTVPEQLAPVVTVIVPEQPAPVVNVAAPVAPIVNVAAPAVTVQMPVEPDDAPKSVKFKRDPNGRITGAELQ